MSARKRCAECGAFAKTKARVCPACGATFSAEPGLLEEAAGALIDGLSSLTKGLPRKPIRTCIHALTTPNADGSSREEIADRCCKIGTVLEARPEPLNPYDSNAIGLWVRDGQTDRRVGYVAPALAAKLARVLEAGGTLRVVVLDVSGGMIRSKKVSIVIDPEIPETPVEAKRGMIARVGRSKAVEMVAKAGGPVPTIVHRLVFGRKK